MRRTIFWKAARASGEPIRLAPPPDAVLQYGVLFFVEAIGILHTEFPELDFSLAVDCGDRADLAHAALKHGLNYIVFRGDRRVAEKLIDIAQGLSATVETAEDHEGLQKPN